MASFARSTLLRQSAAFAAPSSIRFSSTVAARSSPASLLRQKPSPIAQTVPRIAAFHATSRRNLLPVGPQVIVGTVNDAAPIPPADPSHGSYHWTFERLVAGGLIPLTLAPFAAGSLNPTLDAVLCATLLVHTHLSLQTIVVDYVPTKEYPTLRKVSTWSLNIITALVGLGLYEFETNDVGVTELVSKLWKA